MTATVMVDNCSNSTLISERFRKKMALKPRDVQKATVHGSGQQSMSTSTGRVTFKIKTKYGDTNQRQVEAWTIQKIMRKQPTSNWKATKQRLPHLRDLPLEDVEGEPDIMIGQDQVDFQKPLESRNGNSGEPYAVKTILGWIARGPCDGKRPSQTIEFHHTELVRDEDLVKHFFDGETFGTEFKKRSRKEEEGKETLKFIKENLVKEEDKVGYCATLPWKKEAPTLKDNRLEAERRLQGTLRKCSKDPKYAEDYEKGIQKYLACLLYTSPSPRDLSTSRMPSSA